MEGSKAELPRTIDHERTFGIGDNGIFPQARVTAIVEVHTGLAWDWRIGGSSACEKGHLMEMAADLREDVLLLADGTFVGHPIWSSLHEGGKRFLIRVGGNVGLLTGLWPETQIERQGGIVCTWPSARRRASAPLRLRLIRVADGLSPVYLLTNVLDHRRLSDRAAGAIYRARRGVELFYRMFKRTLGHAKLLSRSGRRARIELEWSLIGATIMALMGIAALHGRRRDPRRLSPAALARALRASFLRGRAGRAQRASPTRATALSCAVRDRYVRRSPKRSRRRPITRNTPKQHTLKPPRVREATAEERRLARMILQSPDP